MAEVCRQMAGAGRLVDTLKGRVVALAADKVRPVRVGLCARAFDSPSAATNRSVPGGPGLGDEEADKARRLQVPRDSEGS